MTPDRQTDPDPPVTGLAGVPARTSRVAIVRALYRLRRWVLGFYLLVWGGFLTLLLIGPRVRFSEWDQVFRTDELERMIVRAGLVLVLVAMQVVLIVGFGHLRVQTRAASLRPKLWAAVVSMLVMAWVFGLFIADAIHHEELVDLAFVGSAALMLVTGLVSGLRLGAYAPTGSAPSAPTGLLPEPRERRARTVHRVVAAMAVSVAAMILAALVTVALYAGSDFLDIPGRLLAVLLVAVFAVSWIVWFVVAARLMKRGKQTRLVQLLYVGSWVEFAVAVPIYLSQDRGCICVLGSWVALVIGVPAILLTTGPAIWLLYRHEVRQSFARPEEPQAILLEKSRIDGLDD